MIDQRAIDRAGNGAELLDREKPRWWEKVDLEILDMRSPYQCTLGQVYGDYLTGIEVLGLEPFLNETLLYGFACYRLSEEDYVDYDELTKAWIGEIEDRLLIEGR